MADGLHREFTDDIGKEATEAYLECLPEEWKADAFASSLTYIGVGNFHRPGIVLSVELVVAIPQRQ